MDYKLPEVYQLTRIAWQFFGTLTFREPSLRERECGKAAYRRLSKFLAFGRKLHDAIDYSPKNFEKHNINCLRLEAGEIGGLWHLHFLMAGLGQHQVNMGTCKFMESLWLSKSEAGIIHGGWCDVRVFDSSQNGIEYVSKCLDPKNKYEFNKFGLAQSLTFSPSFRRVLEVKTRKDAAFCNAGKKQDRGVVAGVSQRVIDSLPSMSSHGAGLEVSAV